MLLGGILTPLFYLLMTFTQIIAGNTLKLHLKNNLENSNLI